MPRQDVSPDRRVQRTREALRHAFIDLVLRRPYGAIRVADIVAGAGVGRSTFYEHFRGKDDLLCTSMEPLLAAIADGVGEDCDVARLERVVEHFWHNRRLARAVLRGEPARQLARALADMIARRVAGRGARLVAVHIAEGQLGLLRAWLGGEQRGTAAEVAAVLRRGARAPVRDLPRR